MKIRLLRYVITAALLLSACGDTTTSTDGGDASHVNDLASSPDASAPPDQATPDDLAVSNDLAMPDLAMNDLSMNAMMNDLSMNDLSMNDLSTHDLAMNDLTPARDLEAPSDLTVPPDMATPPVKAISFFAAPVSATLHKPTAAITGDWDGNGILDVATVSSTSNTVDTLLGHGDGTFLPGVSLPVDLTPSAVATYDFNGDGKADLVVGTQAMTVDVLLGNGDGTFKASVAYPVGNIASGVAAADFNGDKKLDLIVVGTGSNDASLLLGNGDGTFQAAKMIAAADGYTVVVADFNGDGKMDFATEYLDAAIVAIGDGTGAFVGTSYQMPNMGPSDIVAVDVNGDGKLDLATANSAGSTIGVIINSGGGVFAAPVTYASGTAPTTIAAADWNGDGKPDLVTTNSGLPSPDSTVMLNKGDGTFLAPVPYETGHVPTWVVTGDFNADGLADILVADDNTGDGDVCALLNQKNVKGVFVDAPSYANVKGAVSAAMATGDLNKDGKPDVAFTTNTSSVQVLLNDGTGKLLAASTIAGGMLLGASGMRIADVNGDGAGDLLVASKTGSSLDVLLGNGNGTFQAQVAYPSAANGNPSTPQGLEVGDLNGDGKLDVVLADSTTNGVDVFLGMGNGTFMPFAFTFGGTTTVGVSIGDFNGDGKLDVVTANTVNTPIGILLGKGDGTFQALKNFNGTQVPTGGVVVGDFNGDGKLDVATANIQMGSVSLYYGNGDGTLQAEKIVQTPAGNKTAKVMVAGDWNGDGKSDLAVTIDGYLWLLVGNKTGVPLIQGYAVGQTPIALQAGDLDGDGKLDVAVQNSKDYTVSVLLGR